MPDQEWIAYVGPFRFPWGQACSRRVMGNALSIAATGRRVVVLSGEDSSHRGELIRDEDAPPEIRHVGLAELPLPSASLLEKTRLYLNWGKRTVDWLDAQSVRPTHVFIYGGGSQYATRLMLWGKRNGVAVIADVVEWYDPGQLRGGRFGADHVSAKLALKWEYPRCDGVVAISEFLAQYYRLRGQQVVTIPPTLDVEDIAVSAKPRRDNQRLKLLYAGTPGMKDGLGTVVRAVQTLPAPGRGVELVVAGPTPEEVTDLIGAQELPANVTVLGRIPQPAVSRLVQDADFTVLLRPRARFTQAGFPTKFVESLANGTPVICNITSDLRIHTRDGIDSLICVDDSINALQDSLGRAMQLSETDLAAMASGARDRAICDFDYRVHSKSMNEFLTATDVR